MISALASAVVTVFGRLRRWIAAVAALLGVFWLSNRRAERRGRQDAERDATARAERDVADRFQTRQRIERQSRDGGARDRMRDRLRARQEERP